MKPLITHSNELIDSSYSLDVNEARLIMYACSMINSKNKNIGEIIINSNDFARSFDMNLRNAHRNLKLAVAGIAKKPIRVINIESGRESLIPWLTFGDYDTDSGYGSYVVIEFNKLIEPYLFELKSNFTSVSFIHASKLDTPFSFRLYQWLIKSRNMKNAISNGSISVIIKIDWMISKAMMTGSYTDKSGKFRWDRFNDRVLKPSVQKINELTDISVTTENIKIGKKINAVKFSYVTEKATISKPIRPRLARRPKVTKGSDAEGKWMMTNFNILLEYEKKLKNYDSSAKLTIDDLKKFIEYSKICAPEKHKILLNELTERTKK